ncbi:Splicing factor U2AF 50 kDa subunit [Ceratocystis fimbriata CBS 114723]|uniref:Splicing factor U2AF subunit n=1 Tax=Ceratocystis fimbriata CBS 114723 TaxID=1035309 RepID=A0A2C5XCZ7_9PEZI|nr:Splicing factor U2AF 50 kDa subunit [Ceratocystis fimbriata CBS 114723]
MGEGAPRESRKGSSRDYPNRGDRDSRRDRERDRDRDSHRERRRTRSPEYRGSRRRDDEPDAYSSSRSHREREREDRYSGRERRGGDREWDRERGSERSSRRERRGDDDDRSSRRERERDGGFGEERRRDRGGRDRRGGGGSGGGGGGASGGGGGGGGFDEFPSNRERRTPSPPAKREPTPDLTDIVPVLERKRRMTQWDIKPPGYDNVPAEQAKMSGLFALPGAPRQQQQQQPDLTRLQAFVKDNTTTTPTNNATLKPTNARQSKRLLVSNLPASATDESIMAFFNLQLNGLNVIESTDPCILAQRSKDGSFAIVEFRESNDATVALTLDGTLMEDSGTENGDANGASAGLSIRRPKDYIVPDYIDDGSRERGVVSNVVPDSPNKISICNVAPYFTEEQVTELLVSFGEIKSFVLVRDRHTEESRGVAFCEYADSSSTDIAIQGLNGMELGDKKLRVQKASCGITQVAGIEMGISAMSMLAGTTAVQPDETRVLQLLNMVTPEELLDNEDYEEICEDVHEECSKFGTISELKIPRPTSGSSKQSPGVGKIYVKFETKEAAGKALRALAGRKFSDRTVITTFFPEENFEVGLW